MLLRSHNTTLIRRIHKVSTSDGKAIVDANNPLTGVEQPRLLSLKLGLKKLLGSAKEERADDSHVP